MSSGGARPNAGRKSNNQIHYARYLMDCAINERQWLAIWRNLARIAMSDDDPRAAIAAVRELRAIRFGVPDAQTADLPPNQGRYDFNVDVPTSNNPPPSRQDVPPAVETDTDDTQPDDTQTDDAQTYHLEPINDPDDIDPDKMAAQIKRQLENQQAIRDANQWQQLNSRLRPRVPASHNPRAPTQPIAPTAAAPPPSLKNERLKNA